MANRNIFEALNTTPDGGAPKNPFDLHSFEWLTTKAGQFVPVGCREVVPDGTYDLSVDNYTLTFPCNTASQADMKENYYFLFVPYYLISRSAYAFTVQRKDNHSALDYQFEQMPSFPLGTVVARCIEVASVGEIDALKAAELDDFIDIHGFNIAYGALRLLDMLGYGSYLDILARYKKYLDDELDTAAAAFLLAVKNKLNNKQPNVLRIGAYQKSWYCYFRNSMYDNAISPRSFNFDDVTYPSDTTYNVLDYRTVDQFIIECLQLRYVQNKKDIVSSCMPGTQFGAVSSVSLSTDFVGSVTIPKAAWNSDLWDSESYVYAQSIGGNTYGILKGTPESETGHFQTLNNQILGTGTSINESTSSLRTGHTHPDGSVSIEAGSASLFDVLKLTEAQAVQKWKQKAMLAGSRTRDNWKAHYGVVPRHMVDDYPDFIGSVDNQIQISQVVSQANTLTQDSGKSNLGDIAGRGYGASSEKTFRFHATEYGIIILCRSIVSENVYASYGLDRANQLIYYTDFWQPEFQNIGLEAVPKDIIDSSYSPLDDDEQPPHSGTDDASFPVESTVMGYAPRNYQLKQYQSKVHGIFNPSRFVDVDPDHSAEQFLFGFGQLEAFVQIRRDVVDRMISDNEGVVAWYGFPISLGQIYQTPAITNSTFGFDVDSTEETDTFIHKCRFNCMAVQPLSVIGLPQF